MPRNEGEQAAQKRKTKREIRLPSPMPHQIPILTAGFRFKIIVAGRRWGKTILGLICVVGGHGSEKTRFKGAAQGATIWWVAPTYGIASLIWRDLKWALKDAWVEKREDERYIALPGGGSVTVKSADNPDSLRGIGLDGVVVDEAAYCSEEMWTQALRPALSDKQGWALFISTPSFEEKRGDSWFRRLYVESEVNPKWGRWQRPSSDNTKIPAEEIEEAKKNIPDVAFRQEYLAEFVDLSGGIIDREWFRYYKEDSETLYLLKGQQVEPIPKDKIYKFCTVDLATSSKETADYTVIATWGITPNQDLVLLDLIRGRFEGPKHAEMIWRTYQKWQPAYIGVERTGFQLNLVQTLQYGGISISDGINQIILPPLPIMELKADKDKQSRAMTVAHYYKASKVYHPEKANWLKDFESEIVGFPLSEHDDQMDATGYAGIELSKPSMIMGDVLPIFVMGGGVRQR